MTPAAPEGNTKQYSAGLAASWACEPPSTAAETCLCVSEGYDFTHLLPCIARAAAIAEAYATVARLYADRDRRPAAGV